MKRNKRLFSALFSLLLLLPLSASAFSPNGGEWDRFYRMRNSVLRGQTTWEVKDMIGEPESLENRNRGEERLLDESRDPRGAFE